MYGEDCSMEAYVAWVTEEVTRNKCSATVRHVYGGDDVQMLRNLCVFSGHYQKASLGLSFSSSLFALLCDYSLRFLIVFLSCSFLCLFVSSPLPRKCPNDFEFCQNP